MHLGIEHAIASHCITTFIYCRSTLKQSLITSDICIPQDMIYFRIVGLTDNNAPLCLQKDMMLTLQRHTEGQDIFKAIGDVGPAMGMIGTLIGLVQMLSNMDDPKQIGPAMAVALLTTLYGAILANMVALPVADKLALRSVEEKDRKRLIIDALLSIQEGQNPRVIESMLEAYLPKSLRTKEDE